MTEFRRLAAWTGLKDIMVCSTLGVWRAVRGSIGTLLLSWTTAGLAAGIYAAQDIERVRATAQEFVQTQLRDQGYPGQLFVAATALDSRLRLPACDAQTAFLPAGASIGAHVTVGVRCAQPAWTVYVPLTVESELPVLVLKRSLARGTDLTAADVEAVSRRVQGLAASYVLDIAALAGKHLKYDAAPGTAVTVDLLQQDVLIRHGQRVTLVASAGGIDVRAQGEAVTDASTAGRVRVRNLNSQKVVEGQVESADLVRVAL